MKRYVLVLLAFLLIPVGSASAGTYDVVVMPRPRGGHAQPVVGV